METKEIRAKITTNEYSIELEGGAAIAAAMQIVDKLKNSREEKETPEAGEVESVTIRLTNGKLAQFDITDRGDGWVRFDSRACFGRSPWNESGNTEGDISESTLQRYLDNQVSRLLPAWLDRMIIHTTRISADDEQYDTRLFVPDASEIFGSNEDRYESRYQRLSYYNRAYNRMKVDIENEDSPCYWWSASALSGHSLPAVIVITYDMSYDTAASNSYGVPPCFRINAADLGDLISEALNSGGTVRRIQEGQYEE